MKSKPISISSEMMQMHCMYSTMALAVKMRDNMHEPMPRINTRNPENNFQLNVKNRADCVGSMPNNVKCPRIIWKIFIFATRRRTTDSRNLSQINIWLPSLHLFINLVNFEASTCWSKYSLVCSVNSEEELTAFILVTWASFKQEI